MFPVLLLVFFRFALGDSSLIAEDNLSQNGRGFDAFGTSVLGADSVRDRVRAIKADPDLSEEEKRLKVAQITEALQEAGAIPVTTLSIPTKMGMIGDVRYYRHSNIEDLAWEVYEQLDVSPRYSWHVTSIGDEIEKILDAANITEDKRVWPGGTVNMPDRIMGLLRTFKRVKLHYSPEYTVWDDQLDAIAAAIEEHAQKLGRPIPVVKVNETKTPDEDSLYILYTYGDPIILPKYYIAVQMEQVCAWTPGPRYVRKLRGALEVWEYAAINIPALHALGIHHVRHVPLTFSPRMVRPVNARRASHVIFFGGMLGRRTTLVPRIYERITQAGYRFFSSDHVRGDARFNALVALNVHSFNSSIMEVHRIFPLITNLVYVVSEPSNDTWYDDRVRDIVDVVPTERLEERILEVLRVDGRTLKAELERRRAKLLEEWDPWRVMYQVGALDFIAQRAGPIPWESAFDRPLA